MDNTDVIVFGEKRIRALSPGRRIAAQKYIESALANGAVMAIEFQKALLEDEEADLGLRFKASEAILDRFMGKAAQELRIGETETRPIMFDAKLRALKEGMEAAIDVAKREGSGMQEAFEEAVTDHLIDHEGVTI